MADTAKMLEDLRQHMAVCRELLALVEQESKVLNGPEEPVLGELHERKKVLFPLLDESVGKVKTHRIAWQEVPAAERSNATEVNTLIRQCADLTMKVITLDRENEQQLLKRGLVPPDKVPSANRQRPHYVADLYRKNVAP